MLVSTGRKETLSVSIGSQIEYGDSTLWYSAILEENLAKSKRKKLSVRHLDPLLKEDYSPPLIKTAVQGSVRPVPPSDLFTDVDFEAGDVVDAADKGAWRSGVVIKVLENQCYLVSFRFGVDVIEIERKYLRPCLVWEHDEWFRFEKRKLMASDFRNAKAVEVRTEVDNLGYVWAPARAIKEDNDGTLLVKYHHLSGEVDECVKISLPDSEIRPLPPPADLKSYNLMQKVDVVFEFGWCPGVVRKVLSGNRFTVLLGPNKESKEFTSLDLRPSVEWKDGVWHIVDKDLDSEETPHAAEETIASPGIRVSARNAEKKALSAGKTSMATRSLSNAMQDPLLTFTNGGNVAEVDEVSVTVSETPLSKTAAKLTVELGSEITDVVMNGNTLGTNQQEIAAPKEIHSSVVLGVAATSLNKPTVKTQGKTPPRKKLQAMRNQKGSANDSVGEKAPEEMKNRESINKRKRGQPRKFISTEPKQKTGVADNGSKAATIDLAGLAELADMTDDDRPLASWIHGANISLGLAGSRQSVSRTSDVVEKHVNVVATPPAKESAIVLPFVKKSPLWNYIESMEVFKAVPQRPHFSPLLENEEDFREGQAVGTMVNYATLLEKVNNLQVHDTVSSINSIDECFLKLEKHGFDVTAPRSRIAKLLSIKESQTCALQELKAAEKEITENDYKRRKYEEDMIELQRRQELIKEAKAALDQEIARMQSHVAVLDEKVQIVDEEFRALVAAPWKLAKP